MTERREQKIEISDNAVIFDFRNGYHHIALVTIIGGKIFTRWKVPIGEMGIGVPVSSNFGFEEVSFAAIAFGSNGLKTLQMSTINPPAWEYVERKLKEAGYQVICVDDYSNPSVFMNIFTVDDRKKFHELGFETRFTGTKKGVIEKTFLRMNFGEHAITSREIVDYFLGIGIPAREAWTRRDFGDMDACIRPETIYQALIVDKLRKQFDAFIQNGIYILRFSQSRGKVISRVEGGIVVFPDKSTLCNAGVANKEDLSQNRYWTRVEFRQTGPETKIGTAHIIAPFVGLSEMPTEISEPPPAQLGASSHTASQKSFS